MSSDYHWTKPWQIFSRTKSKFHRPHTLIIFMNKTANSLLSCVWLGCLTTIHAQSFYKEIPLFSTAPSETASVNTIGRFGPVGMAIDLHQPAFTMVVGEIEPGSPAAAVGALKKGQIIESINGQTLKDIDPRIQLAQILETAEATDGIVKFAIKGEASPVVVKIPVLGAYSKTWPLNCPKSEKIVRGFADYISNPKSNKGFADAGMLFLLSTGDDKDLAPVREWVHGLAKKNTTGYAWHIGIGGIPLCEYYLRTGDPVALPVIQSWVNAAAKGEYLDGWAGRGGVVQLKYGNGHLNAGGTSCVTFLMLAKQCGADVNDSLLHRTLVHFFRYAGRGVTPYGDDRPETSFVDNGKHSNLAMAMAAAASLTPEGEKSIYARARDICAMMGFYTTTYMLHGHTGGGVGEVWRSGAMSLLQEKKPLQYREFMDHRKWHYDLSRRFDGSFAILGGANNYDNIEWGALYPWAYTFPRKTLRITGAPPSKFSQTYQLPTRPWGTESDDIFLSMESVPNKDGKCQDLSGETIATASAKPFIEHLNEKELSDDEIRRHVRHPEYIIRHMIANNAAGESLDYMFTKPGKRVRPELIEELARDGDPRVRNAGIRAAVKAFDPEADWCKRLFDFAIDRLKDDKESWFIKDACLTLVQCGTPDMVVPHADLLVSYLKHPEQWLQQGALMALTGVATDERCYAKVLPPMGELFSKTPRQSTTSGPLYALREKLSTASGKVRDAALKAMGGAYQEYSGTNTWAGGQDMTKHRRDTLGALANTLTGVPGGYDVLYQVAKTQFPDEPLPHAKLFLSADSESFGPDLKKAFQPLIREQLIYQYIGLNRSAIFRDLETKSQSGTVTNSIDGLVSLYQKIGVQDYDWKSFNPDLKNTQWNYLTFEPAEKQAFDKSPWRYRPVTYPKGMENWFSPEFDPAAAGWKKGMPPFGQFKGKLTDNRENGRNLWTESEYPRTLWEHEVLLAHGKFDFPAFKPGHIYRLRVQTGKGVGAGDGFKVYMNGKPLVESKAGLGRREGEAVRGGWITPAFREGFGKGPVTIAATSFLRYGDRAVVQMPPAPQGTFSLWLEERKLPPLDDTVLARAATFVPMLCSEWQMQNDPENSKKPSEDDKFRYDGKFVSNPKISGTWKTVGLVKTIDEFAPDTKSDFSSSPLKQITFKDQGSTDLPNWIWSDDTLMDLTNSTALKITPKSIGGTDYLFIEAGGFGPKNPAGWQSPLIVMKQQ